MISGRQTREARALLNWSVSELRTRTSVSEEIIKRAESVDGTPSITLRQGGRIQQAFEAAGIEFQNGHPSVRMRARPDSTEIQSERA